MDEGTLGEAMNNRRKLVIALGAGALVAPLALLAQQQLAKIPRLGYMSLQSQVSEAARLEGFRQGLRDLGYVEGKNIAIEYLYADGASDRLAAIAAELVSHKVDINIAGGNTVADAAKRATQTIPIVFPVHGDPLGSGLITSLARPGGNLTGFASLAIAVSAKRLQLLKETVPRLSNVAVLTTSENPSHRPAINGLNAAAVSLGIHIQAVEIKSIGDLEAAFSTIRKKRFQALMLLPDETFNTRRGWIAALAIKARLPTILYNSDWAEDGALLTYGTDVPDLFRRSAVYVDKILKGAKPADLPVQQAQKFELIINLKTAKQIGLKILPNMLARADKVIE